MIVRASNRGLWASTEARERFQVEYHERPETEIHIGDKRIGCGYHAAKHPKQYDYTMVHSHKDVKSDKYFMFHQCMFQYANPVEIPVSTKGDFVLSVGTKHKDHTLCRGIKNLVVSINPRYVKMGGRLPKAKVLYHTAPNDYGKYLEVLAKAKVVVIPVKKHAGLTAGITTVVDAICMNKWVVTNEDLSDYITHGKNGYIVKPSEFKDAVEAAREPENNLDLSYTACLNRVEEICANLSR